MRSTNELALVVSLVMWMAAGPADAQEDASLRDVLAQRGVTFEMTVQADHSTNLRGGVRQGTAFRRPLAFGVDLDAERLVGWKGARLHAGLQSHAGDHGTESLVGDAQGFDNADADRFAQVSELWLEQVLFSGKLRLKLGKMDANGEFAGVESGGGFLNSSAGFSPTIQGFPTYPDPSTSVNVFVEPAAWLYAGAGLYDGATQDGCHGRTGNRGPSTFWGAPSSVFLVGEAGVRLDLGGRKGRLGVGAWRHTATFERLAGGSTRGTSGAYATLDQAVWSEPSDGNQGIGLFAQWGGADGAISEIDRHLAVGAAWTGALAGRDRDALGLMVSSVRFGKACEAGAAGGRHETALELFYGAQVTPWLLVKPDVQVILNPGGREMPGAVVATVRAAVSF